MKGGGKAPGFTIVETLIVLAVTGFLLVSALTLISGRQNRAMFVQSIRDVESRLQQSISEVSTGFYPSTGNFRCVASAGEPLLTAGVSKEQGSNQGCIFLGKAIQFGVDAPDSSVINTYSMIGLRRTAAGVVTTMTDARPRLIARSATDPASVPDVLDISTMPYGLTVTYMRYNNSQPIAAVGFVSRLGATFGAADSSQQVDLVAFTGTTLGQTKEVAANSIKNSARALPASAVNPTGGVQICLRSGTTNQSGLINIGGEGRQLAITTSIKSTDNCT